MGGPRGPKGWQASSLADKEPGRQAAWEAGSLAAELCVHRRAMRES